MAFGVNSNGFRVKTREEIETSLKNEAKKSSNFGPGVFLGADDFLGQLIGTFSQEIADLWLGSQQRYNSQFLSTSTGVSLDRNSLVSRIRNRASIVTLIFSGTNGTIISSGTQVDADNGIRFATNEEVTIANGAASVLATASVTGMSGNVQPDTVTSLVTAISGVASVTNPASATGGLDLETDPVFRARSLRREGLGLSSSLIDVANAVRDLPGVIKVSALENVSNMISSEGIPANSFQLTVLGGEDDAIHDVIARRKPAGIRAFGSESKQVNIGGDIVPSAFTRSTPVNIFYVVAVTTNSMYNSSNNATLSATIRNNLTRFTGGVDENMIEYQGLGIGQDVEFWKARASLFELGQDTPEGVADMTLALGTSMNPTAQVNIAIDSTQEATTSESSITVNII